MIYTTDWCTSTKSSFLCSNVVGASRLIIFLLNCMLYIIYFGARKEPHIIIIAPVKIITVLQSPSMFLVSNWTVLACIVQRNILLVKSQYSIVQPSIAYHV